MKKKLRKFSEGGYSTIDRENPVPSIDEDTRSRAMKSVEGLEGIKGADIADETGTVKGSIKRNEYGDLYDSDMKATKAKPTVVAKPKADVPYSKPAGNYVNPEKGLEAVYPLESTLIGGGSALLKPMLKKVVEMGAKRTAAKNATRRSEEGFSPSEALEKLKPTRTVSVKGKEIPVKQGKPNFGGSTENMGVKEVVNKSGKKIPVKKPGMADDGGSGAFKRGGSVSSASRRADGCAIRGKTRA
jgi:hypothetical protein